MRNVIFLIIIIVSSCKVQEVNEGFNSIKLVSSENEKLYINSVNWGVTGDHQLTIITTDSNKLRFKLDTFDCIKGINPFIYSFKNDTLTIYHLENTKCNINSKARTIFIAEKIVNNSTYSKLYEQAINQNTYKTVPNMPEIEYPQSMPRPPQK